MIAQDHGGTVSLVLDQPRAFVQMDAESPIIVIGNPPLIHGDGQQPFL